MDLTLEDGASDIINKAQRGLHLADALLAEKSGITLEALHTLKAGTFSPKAIAAVAPVLGLHPDALQKIADGQYVPGVAAPEGLIRFVTPYEDFTVNSYLAYDEETREAILFDTGADASELLATLTRLDLTVRHLLLTHTHGDHILELDRVMEKTGAAAFGPALEPLEGVEPFADNASFSAGKISVTLRPTHGHSPGGTTFVIAGLPMPVAIVGDSLFAGSAGGAADVWQTALQNNRTHILSLPPETVLAPGHGPLTTVALEKASNPFFA